MANTALIVSGLNFDTIRQNLRDFISAKPDFADYDFNDSAIGTLLDLLAYNTYYNAFYASMAASEAFLDSAQFYDSAVSRAKMIGYRPLSAQGASANVLIQFTTATANSSRPTLTIPQNTLFTATINSVSYTFVTPQAYTVAANSINKFRQYIQLVEGYPLTHRFVYSTSNTSFVLPNPNVDTRSIAVTVTSGANTQTYIEASDIFAVNSSAYVYYVEADRGNKYKIAFGDGVLGARPPYNSIVSVSYRVCNGQAGNGANNFVASSTIAGETNFRLSTIERASGGTEQESIESIKFNAPKSYQIQNRAVISDDYERLILQNFSDLEAVSVWGGEENDPPIYGKIFAAVKPYNGTLISSSRKSDIKTNIRKYNVMSMDLEIVDPTFLYIKPAVTVDYDSRYTTLSASQLATAVANRIITFEDNNFSRFGSQFWLSKFLNYLDMADDSIVGTTSTVDIQKRFVPSTTTVNNYSFDFGGSLLKFGEAETAGSTLGLLTSSSFTYQGFESYLDDDGFGTIRTYYRSPTTNARIYTNLNAGTIDYDTGLVSLTSFLPSAFSGDEVKINVRPRHFNVEATKNQLLFFVDATVTVSEINNANRGYSLTTIATQGESTTLNESGIVSVAY